MVEVVTRCVGGTGMVWSCIPLSIKLFFNSDWFDYWVLGLDNQTEYFDNQTECRVDYLWYLDRVMGLIIKPIWLFRWQKVCSLIKEVRLKPLSKLTSQPPPLHPLYVSSSSVKDSYQKKNLIINMKLISCKYTPKHSYITLTWK